MDFILALLLAVILALCLSLLLFQAITGVPPLSATRTEAANVVALLRQAGLPERAIVYDLGAGWGSLAIALARAFPQARIIGIERSPLPCWIAGLRTRRLPNVELWRADFYDRDISDAHAVTCYLMIKPMPRLAIFLDRMLPADTPVVALAFWFRDRAPAATLERDGLRGAALYRWPAHLRPPRPASSGGA
ncbi:MAG TPA: class I SAM-dependent methyltransferase [Reyranella sp.]|nr:class I SAM-dependent methyltransferase [Reyranella sp.]